MSRRILFAFAAAGLLTSTAALAADYSADRSADRSAPAGVRADAKPQACSCSAMHEGHDGDGAKPSTRTQPSRSTDAAASQSVGG